MGRKYTYLVRLISIVILLLVVPVFVFFSIFWKKTLHEMENRNEEHYGRLLHSFQQDMSARIVELKNHAAMITSSSKKIQSAFYEGTWNFKENKYWYNDAVKEMVSAYDNHGVKECSIYYYDLDCIINSNGTRNLEAYIRDELQVEGENSSMADFFAKETFMTGKMIFSSANTEEDYSNDFLVGYCTKLGKMQDPVLVFYRIAPNEFQEDFSVVYSNEDIYFYVQNRESKDIYLAMHEAAHSEVRLNDLEEQREVGSTHQKRIYEEDGEVYPLGFTIYVTEDSLENNIIFFYHDMKKLIIITICILLLVYCVAICVAYKPVYTLTADLEDYNEGEFETIRNALRNNYAKIEEQEMLIMDLLLKHLVYGVPISENRVKRLGVSSLIQYYCVFMLEGHVLLSNEVETIAAEMENMFASRVFATDWHGENRSIIIVFLKNQDISEIEEWLRNWTDEYFTEEYALYTGKVVDKMDGIRSSLLSCMEKKIEDGKKRSVDKVAIKKEVKTLNPKEEQQQKLKEDILAYLEVHYRDEDLSQNVVADAFQISNYTLSRMFKNQVGIGFVDYINAKRLEYAKELLLTTSYSVREISIMVGFINDNYFSRLFKATVGVSPTAFREK